MILELLSTMEVCKDEDVGHVVDVKIRAQSFLAHHFKSVECILANVVIDERLSIVALTREISQ